MSPSKTREGQEAPHEDSVLEPIAICGMSCRLPGGVDSDSSFWQMLVEKRTGQTPEVPPSRFNIDAHYHETLERPGSFNVRGGYFLDGEPQDFDPSFFGMTPIEAQWLDPQQRRMLEISYECLVSAGRTLDSVAGSNTAVFVGSFTSDYQQISIRDPDFRHNYTATGVDVGIISNRIGHTFNLKGPSFTINTACSSSIYAIHNACNALRAHDCDAAIAGGVNLILTVDQHMNTAKLGILSPTSTCHTFDASADGYGRAEGAGALFLKRLSDAIRDGDPIRALIRSSAVNTNGRIGNNGITHPGMEGQERVIRTAYEKAQLNPCLTAYAELHGTGTPVGDPIEVRAVSHAMNDTRPGDVPLIIGAVKPNIGHSEAASGVFAVMKAALMTEKAEIPGVALFKRLNPKILDKEWNVKVQVDTEPWPSDFLLRRASVSSFGYGGTNGHVIVESVDALYPWYQHAKPKAEADYDHSCDRPLILFVSAHDKATLLRNIAAITAVQSKYYLADLAHTLNLHRTLHSHRAFIIANEDRTEEDFGKRAWQIGSTNTSSKWRRVAFLFTGQGAQWVGMAKNAIRDFTVVLEVIEKLDQVLSKLNPKPDFKIASLLLGDPAVLAERINEAEIAQPLCTAIQIALVDLFASWNIKADVSIGHSSGEIAAAYAAGLVSAPEAIVLAFCRGSAVKSESVHGSMLAVGLGLEEILEFVPEDESSDICIACENSPSSVTLSGHPEAIHDVQSLLTSEGIFARELKTGRPYHSHHMTPVGVVYETMLSQALTFLTEDDQAWRRPRSRMISSVTGIPMHTETIEPNYWSQNLRQRVLFNTAVQYMGNDTETFGSIQYVVEIGPHSALAGPFKQICMAHNFDRFTYIPSLARDKDDTRQLLSVAGSLELGGYKVDLGAVNAESYSSHSLKSKTQYLLVDLPNYQWNYDRKYWAEPRASVEQRARAYPRHDLLGSRVSGLASKTKVWRNVLRPRDVPWLNDHHLGGTAILPAAGYFSLAIEALRQIHESQDLAFESVTLRDVDIKSALTVPDTDEGVEILTSLETTNMLMWYSFSVESYNGGEWSLHCTGKISATVRPILPSKNPVNKASLTQRVSGKTWYKAFKRVGFNYGKPFQQLRSVRTDRHVHHAVADLTILQNSGVMTGESRSLIHPTTVDACIQMSIITVAGGQHKEMPWGVIPTRVEEVSFRVPRADTGTLGCGIAWTHGFEDRSFRTDISLLGENGKPLAYFKNLTCVSYEAALPASVLTGNGEAQPFSTVSWKPDIVSLEAINFAQRWPDLIRPVEQLSKLLELICHRQQVTNILLAGGSSSFVEMIETFLENIPQTANVTIAVAKPIEVADLESIQYRGSVIELNQLTDLFAEQNTLAPMDIVLVDRPTVGPSIPPREFMDLANQGGWIIGSSNQTYSFSWPTTGSQMTQQFAVQKAESRFHLTNGEPNPRLDEVALLSLSTPKSDDLLDSLVKAWPPSLGTVCRKSFWDFKAENDHFAIIDDTAGNLFSSMDRSTFAALKTILTSGVPTLWLTMGVRQGTSAAGGMAEGFLRVIRSEIMAAKVVLLDVSHEEQHQDIALRIIEKLTSANTRESGCDTEFWLHRGILHIPRVRPNDDLNRIWNGTSPFAPIPATPLPMSLQLLANPSRQGTCAFEREFETAELLSDEVEIQVQASELQLAQESMSLVVGSITRLGSALNTRSLLGWTDVGKSAFAIVPGRLQTLVRTSNYAILEDIRIPPETLIQALVPLCRLASFCIGDSSKLTQSHCIFSLPGQESITRMLIMLAKVEGWNLNIIVESESEKQKYASETYLNEENILLSDDWDALRVAMGEKAEDKPCIVIAHDFSPLSQEVWRCVPRNTKFFLLADENSPMNIAPDGLPFSRGASFIPMTKNGLQEFRPQEIHNILKRGQWEIMQATVNKTNIIDVSEICKSDWSSLKQRRDLVVRWDYGQMVKILPETRTLRLTAAKTYLLVGCLGGLGRCLTRWMMEHGAKHFVFISRSGADNAEASMVVQNIKANSCTAKVFRADAADENAVKQIVLEIQRERPVGGVVHAAMVLRDGFFEQMDYNAFIDVIKPKVGGAISLHNALQDADLDFFVMTSSISAVLGNKGQSNYSAANSFLDSLAWHRNTYGLVGTSLVLPMVLGVGVVAEKDDLEASLNRKGQYGIDEQEMLRGFEIAMSESRPFARPGQSNRQEIRSQMIMGMDGLEMANCIAEGGGIHNLDAYWYKDARFSQVRTIIEAAKDGAKSPGDENADKDFAEILALALTQSREAAIEVIAERVAQRLSITLAIPFEDLELDGPSIASYGLDSMIGSEMRTWLFKEFGLDYPFQELLAPTLTFMKLGEVVAQTLGLPSS